MAKKQNAEMILHGNLFRVILFLCIPIVINSFIQTMYNLTDTYFLGKLGTDPMAAITLVTPIQNIVVNFGQGFTTAGAILIAQYIGANDRKNAQHMANQLFVCAMLFSVFCSLLCFLVTPQIIRWLGAEANIFSLSKTYLRIVILDMPFLFLINLFTAVHQSQGDTLHPMLLNLIGIFLNVILDPLFMFVFHWGIAGAALATLFAKIPCALIALIALNKKENDISLRTSDMKLEKHKIMDILRIGLPTAIGGSTMQFGFLLMSKSVYQYGAIAVAAYGIGNRINGLITMPSNAMGSATSTIVGQNVGANQMDRAQRAYLLARRISVIFLVIGGLILSRNVVASSIVRIFSSDTEVILLGTEFLSILAICCWTNGIYNATMGLFQGTGHTMVTMAVDASRLWIFRFLTLFLCQNIFQMGVQSIWYSVVVSNAISALILWILYQTNLWKKEVIKIRNRNKTHQLA